MLSFSENLDKVIEDAMKDYAEYGDKGEPQSMRIMIKPPKPPEFSGIKLFPDLPPIIVDVGMVNYDDVITAVLLGWYACDLPKGNSLDAMLSELLSMEEYFNELEEDTDENDDEQD